MSHVSLQDFLKTEPDGTLEAIAAQYNTTLLEVVKNLPSPTLVSGDQFDTVWETVSEWGKVTTPSILLMSYWNSRVNYLQDSTATVTSTCAAKKA